MSRILITNDTDQTLITPLWTTAEGKETIGTGFVNNGPAEGVSSTKPTGIGLVSRSKTNPPAAVASRSVSFILSGEYLAQVDDTPINPELLTIDDQFKTAGSKVLGPNITLRVDTVTTPPEGAGTYVYLESTDLTKGHTVRFIRVSAAGDLAPLANPSYSPVTALDAYKIEYGTQLAIYIEPILPVQPNDDIKIIVSDRYAYDYGDTIKVTVASNVSKLRTGAVGIQFGDTLVNVTPTEFPANDTIEMDFVLTSLDPVTEFSVVILPDADSTEIRTSVTIKYNVGQVTGLRLEGLPTPVLEWPGAERTTTLTADLVGVADDSTYLYKYINWSVTDVPGLTITPVPNTLTANLVMTGRILDPTEITVTAKVTKYSDEVIISEGTTTMQSPDALDTDKVNIRGIFSDADATVPATVMSQTDPAWVSLIAPDIEVDKYIQVEFKTSTGVSSGYTKLLATPGDIINLPIAVTHTDDITSVTVNVRGSDAGVILATADIPYNGLIPTGLTLSGLPATIEPTSTDYSAAITFAYDAAPNYIPKTKPVWSTSGTAKVKLTDAEDGLSTTLTFTELPTTEVSVTVNATVDGITGNATASVKPSTVTGDDVLAIDKVTSDDAGLNPVTIVDKGQPLYVTITSVGLTVPKYYYVATQTDAKVTATQYVLKPDETVTIPVDTSNIGDVTKFNVIITTDDKGTTVIDTQEVLYNNVDTPVSAVTVSGLDAEYVWASTDDAVTLTAVSNNGAEYQPHSTNWTVEGSADATITPDGTGLAATLKLTALPVADTPITVNAFINGIKGSAVTTVKPVPPPPPALGDVAIIDDTTGVAVTDPVSIDLAVATTVSFSLDLIDSTVPEHTVTWSVEPESADIVLTPGELSVSVDLSAVTEAKQVQLKVQVDDITKVANLDIIPNVVE